MNEPSDWDQLVIDNAASPPKLNESRYADWLARQRIFISSAMDPQMTPYRGAVREALEVDGAEPVRWETLAPKPKDPERAYLDGVAQSSVFVLILGDRYGVSDRSGFSPTHQEANEAAKLHKPQLLFTLPAGERDGRLNDWLRSTYATSSSLQVTEPGEMVHRLDAAMREMAAKAAAQWIKLGRYVFPGRTERLATASGGTKVVVTARTRSAPVRAGLERLTGNHGQRELWLTDAGRCEPVLVEEVGSSSEFNDETLIRINCRVRQAKEITQVSFNGVTPVQQAERWCSDALLGKEAAEVEPHSWLPVVRSREEVSLPLILSRHAPSEWQAEGLVRLYVIEGLKRQRGAEIDHLDVGPAAQLRVPIKLRFTISQTTLSRGESGDFQGVVLPAP